MNLELIITNIGYAISLIVCLTLGIFVFIRRPKDKPQANIAFSLLSVSIIIWQLSYVLGINISDPYLSRLAFMFNLVTLFLAIFTAHMIIYVTDRMDKQKYVLGALYAIAVCLVAFYIVFPDTFLLPSKPQLYLPNFFVPGPLYEIQDSFFFIIVAYFMVQMFLAYRKADYVLRNKLKYFIVSIVYGYVISLSAEFLLYGIKVDPILSCLTGLYTVPMAYTMIKYDTININVLAKRALVYGLSIGSVTLILLLISYTNDLVGVFYPGFPQWIVPLLSGIMATSIGVFIWKRMKELDVLKYEFVDVVTHKFRTPLTHIKWSIENLKAKASPDEKPSLDVISEASQHLYELTDIMAGISGSGEDQFLDRFSTEDFRDVLKEAISNSTDRFRDKNISIEQHIPETLLPLYIDRKKVVFALEMILDNAVLYSSEKSTVVLNAEQKKDHLLVSIKDFGIGISKEDLPRLFSKFYRSKEATSKHTEGLGIGIYLARDMLRRQGGDIYATSEGLGKGSTFYMKMPTKR